MSIKTMLNDEIMNELEELGKIQVGSEDYKVTVDGVTKLCDRLIEMGKLDAEAEERKRNHEDDILIKQQQLRETKKDNTVKNVITVIGIAIPAGVTIWGAVKSFEFEKEGTITTIFGRGFLNKILKK